MNAPSVALPLATTLIYPVIFGKPAAIKKKEGDNKMCMYFLIRNGYCVGVSESLKELEQQKQIGDVISEMKDEKRADEIFTLDEEGNLIKR